MCLKLKDCHPSKIYIFGERIVSISMEKEKKYYESQNWEILKIDLGIVH